MTKPFPMELRERALRFVKAAKAGCRGTAVGCQHLLRGEVAAAA